MKISELAGVSPFALLFPSPFLSLSLSFLFFFTSPFSSPLHFPPLFFPAFLFLLLCSAHFLSFYFSSFANTEPTSPAPSLPAAGTEEQTQTSTPPDGPAQIQTQQQQQQQQIAQLPIILPQCTMHNAGNDAMLCLFALQKLLDPAGTRVPSVKKGRIGRPGAGQQPQQQQLGNTAGVYVNGMGMNGMVAMNGMNGMVPMNGMAMNGMGMGMNMG